MSGKQLQSNTALVQQRQPTSLAPLTPKEEKKLILADYVTKFAIIANRAPTPTLLDIFEEALSDLSPSRLRAGMDAWLRSGDRFPWPSDIREGAEL